MLPNVDQSSILEQPTVTKPSSAKTKFIKKVSKRSKPETLVIKELQTDHMPRREAL